LALVTGKSTLQNYLGKLEHNFPHSNTIDRVTTAGEILTIIALKTNLITIEKGYRGDYIMVDTMYELEDIPVLTKHEIIYEPIPKHTSNKSDDHGSLILGHRENRHDKDICLAHLDRMNSIPLKLNRQLLRTLEEKPTFLIDTLEKKQQWDNFIRESYEKYLEIVHKGNKFYLAHKYDKRGRTYAQGYHVTTQGSTFKKAVVQLYNTEIIPMERSI
jgi:hypothetical protein